MTQQATASIIDSPNPSRWYVEAMEHLVSVVQELSLARDIDSVAAIVRKAARELTSADGATFVLREGDQCYYADENAVSPLWKGQHFPMNACISGWVMTHGEPVVIEDIYADERIPAEAYRSTFVKSLAMVPIRRASPIGAIGNYWASTHRPAPEVIHVLQALADTTSVAMENIRLYGELTRKVQTLEESNYELNRFAWVASHDLQEPLRTIVTQVQLLEQRYGDKLDIRGKNYINRATQGASRLQQLIGDLLVHAQLQKVKNFRPLALENVLENVLNDLNTLIKNSGATIHSETLPWVWGDPVLLERLLQNLLTNAIKFQKQELPPRVQITAAQDDKHWRIGVADNGIGIESTYLERIFGLFQRLHSQDMYPGSGIGLATCKKVVELHEGRIWAESVPGEGSTFYFILPSPEGVDKYTHH